MKQTGHATQKLLKENAIDAESNTGTITNVVEDKITNEEIILGTISFNMAKWQTTVLRRKRCITNK